MSKRRKIFYFVVSIFIFFYLAAGKKIFRPVDKVKKDYQYLALFSEIAAKTKTEYFEDISPGQKFPGAFTEMLSRLDKESAYLDAQQTNLYDLYRTATPYSLGIYGAKLSDYFYISDVLKDSPADKAGLTPGDIIKSIHGASLYALPFYQMYLSLISDKPGNIEISVFKKISKKTENIRLHTQYIESKTRIFSREDNILIIKIPKINDEGANYLAKNLKDTQPLKLIIDLRNYSGGNFESFLKITKIFFRKSPGFVITLKKKEKEEDFPIGANEALDYRAVVIVNKSTMMYGELLAFLFKITAENQNYNMKLIGRRTPGFISELKQIKFADGSSILVSAGFFKQKDIKVAKSGIKPHIELKAAEFDTIMDRCATLLNEDKNPDG